MTGQDADRSTLPGPREQGEFARATYHRFQNHLQGLLGLLAIQRRQASGSGSMEIIDDLAAQIGAIASVYRVRGDDAELRVGVRELVAAIAAGVAGSTRVKLQAPQDPVPVHLREDEAVPIALVLQGLLRHLARLAGAAVCVTVRREGDRVTVSLSADAPAVDPGAQAGQDRPGRDPGLALCRSLLPAAGADLADHGGDGTAFSLTLSPPVIAPDRGPR